MYKVLGLGLQKKEVEGEERRSELGRGRRKKRQELWRRWPTKLGYGCREFQQPAKALKPLEEELVETPMLVPLVYQEAAVVAEFLDPWLGLIFAS